MIHVYRLRTLSFSLFSSFACFQINLVNSQMEVMNACPEGPTVLAETGESGCCVGVSLALGGKCERCWYQCESVGSHRDHPTLCSRCHDVVKALGITPPVCSDGDAVGAVVATPTASAAS